MKTEQEMIKAWKENEKPFGLVDKDMQDWSTGVDRANFEYYHYAAGGFKSRSPNNSAFVGDTVYRIRQDYQTEPEVIELEIQEHCDGLSVKKDNGLWFRYVLAPSICPKDGFRFIGYKYEGMDNLYIEPAMYITPSGAKRGFRTLKDDCDVILPTHAVYKKAVE